MLKPFEVTIRCFEITFDISHYEKHDTNLLCFNLFSVEEECEISWCNERLAQENRLWKESFDLLCTKVLSSFANIFQQFVSGLPSIVDQTSIEQLQKQSSLGECLGEVCSALDGELIFCHIFSSHLVVVSCRLLSCSPIIKRRCERIPSFAAKTTHLLQ